MEKKRKKKEKEEEGNTILREEVFHNAMGACSMLVQFSSGVFVKVVSFQSFS